MSPNNVNYAAEESIVDYLISQCDPLEATASYYTGAGVSVEDLQAPAVFVNCNNGNEVYPYSNVYDLTVNVEVKEMAADINGNPAGGVGILGGIIYNALCFSGMKQAVNLNNSHSFSSQMIQKMDNKHRVNGDAIISEFTMKVIGCMSGSFSSSYNPIPSS